SKTIQGESGLVDERILDGFKNIYKKKFSEYAMSDVFNCDETGLFFKSTPSRTLFHESEEHISGKFDKDRVTILFCVSMLGEKSNPLIIGKFARPRGFKNLDFKRLNVSYRHTKKAWMNLSIFKEWLYQLNEKMKYENRKILLLSITPVYIRLT
ncbi:Tigger transposable element-derived protein 6, partial [Dictyocoela muelleri]